jgi:hypothetical protein
VKYQLAKELKDEGFPQPDDPVRSPGGSYPDHEDDEQSVYIPTLEELIEACGKQFDYLDAPAVWHDNTTDPEAQWAAISHQGSCGIGPTPAEAVARLWLALNRKEE